MIYVYLGVPAAISARRQVSHASTEVAIPHARRDKEKRCSYWKYIKHLCRQRRQLSFQIATGRPPL